MVLMSRCPLKKMKLKKNASNVIVKLKYLTAHMINIPCVNSIESKHMEEPPFVVIGNHIR